jgi:hypothetical protein
MREVYGRRWSASWPARMWSLVLPLALLYLAWFSFRST